MGERRERDKGTEGIKKRYKEGKGLRYEEVMNKFVGNTEHQSTVGILAIHCSFHYAAFPGMFATLCSTY
jgi:hypothetical protein